MNTTKFNTALLQSLGLSEESAEVVMAHIGECHDDMLMHSKLRLELGLALGLKGLPERGDTRTFIDAIEALKGGGK
jgi:hypothetical protein